MRLGSRAVVLAFAVVVAAGLAPPALGYSDGEVLFEFHDDRIGESSGVVASSVRDGVFFTHNDSGDSARFFALDDEGCTLATYSLPGATAIDWEDMAAGPAPDGSRLLWFGDIGDNFHQRGEGIDVYRVPEPNMNAASVRESDGCRTGDERTTEWTRFHLRYVDGAHDAETLLADPVTGQLFVVTKSPLSESIVYAAPNPLVEGADNVLSPVAAIVFPPSTTLERGVNADSQMLFDAAGRLMATGGDIAPDRSRVVVRTYTDAWEWEIPGGDLAAAFAGLSEQVPLRYTAQGEAITYTRDGQSLVTTCEVATGPCVAHRYGPG